MSHLSNVEGFSCQIDVAPKPKDRIFFSFHLNAHVKVKFHCRLNPLMSFTLHDFRQASETSLYYMEKYDVRIILASARPHDCNHGRPTPHGNTDGEEGGEKEDNGVFMIVMIGPGWV